MNLLIKRIKHSTTKRNIWYFFGTSENESLWNFGQTPQQMFRFHSNIYRLFIDSTFPNICGNIRYK